MAVTAAMSVIPDEPFDPLTWEPDKIKRTGKHRGPKLKLFPFSSKGRHRKDHRNNAMWQDVERHTEQSSGPLASSVQPASIS